jgi:hypothetical protein
MVPPGGRRAEHISRRRVTCARVAQRLRKGSGDRLESAVVERVWSCGATTLVFEMRDLRLAG